MAPMYDTKPQAMALGAVHGYVTLELRKGLESSDPTPDFQVYLVWYAFVLGNWKALVSTTVEDGRYYEVTFNKEKQELYLDSYVKEENICMPIPQDYEAGTGRRL